MTSIILTLVAAFYQVLNDIENLDIKKGALCAFFIEVDITSYFLDPYISMYVFSQVFLLAM